MRWLWGNSTPPSCSRTISVSSWSARKSTMATGPPRKVPQDQRSRWVVNIGSKAHHKWMLLLMHIAASSSSSPYEQAAVWLGSPVFPHFYVCLGGPEEYRWGDGSWDAQGYFRRPAERGRDGSSDGGRWRRRHLSGEHTCSLSTYKTKCNVFIHMPAYVSAFPAYPRSVW